MIGTAMLDKIIKHEQELPPASQEAATKSYKCPINTTQHGPGKSLLGMLILKEQHL